jgi:glycosyltransferase involved in cell wall biosynthesis
VARALRVLFVSKPIAPPWHDGSKNLVRDVASNLTRARPTILTTLGTPSIGPRVTHEPLYKSAGKFAPELLANARVMARLAVGDAQDVWHFVFAPNSASSAAARVARTLRHGLGWKGHVVQTVASAPKHFAEVRRFLFGDRVVVLSEWMRGRLLGAGVAAKNLSVIPPCAAEPAKVTPEVAAALRMRLGLGDGPIVVYPGDYEVSTGAATVVGAVRSVVGVVSNVEFVFACRMKTKSAAAAKSALSDEIRRQGIEGCVHLVGEIDDLHALLGTASAVAFPVDDLYGKVDLPLVVLESLALGVPLVLARGGPLESIDAARFVDPGDAGALGDELATLLTDETASRDLARRGRREYEARYSPRVVAAQYDDLYDAWL